MSGVWGAIAYLHVLSGASCPDCHLAGTTNPIGPSPRREPLLTICEPPCLRAFEAYEAYDQSRKNCSHSEYACCAQDGNDVANIIKICIDVLVLPLLPALGLVFLPFDRLLRHTASSHSSPSPSSVQTHYRDLVSG